jgi:galactose-1-phosphate uridylyltransferase
MTQDEMHDIGFITLTLHHSQAPAHIRCKNIASFYRKDDLKYTSVYMMGNHDYFMVSETPEEVAQQIREIYPDLR